MTYTVLITRTEVAQIQVKASSSRAAETEAQRIVDAAACLADLDLEWDLEGDLYFKSVTQPQRAREN